MSDEIDDDTNGPWFPEKKLEWRLDVVTLLAVIGEASMTEHAQAITASALILPAPQAFLSATRPQRMPETKATVTGVESGVALDSIGFFASILVPIDLPAYNFQVWNIRLSENRKTGGGRADGSSAPATFLGRLKGWFGSDTGAQESDVEMGGLKGPEATSAETSSSSTSREGEDGPVVARGIRRQNTLKAKVANALVSGGRSKRPAIPAQLASPLHLLTLLSFVNSVIILICAILWRDGTAILSIALISLTSSIIGYASWWEPRLMSVQGDSKNLPDGDIMIRTREGAFIYIKCKEDVARELFSGTEECKYHLEGPSRNLFMAVGTVLLMLAVVLLGNCKWNSQIFIGASYIVLNGLYWGMGMLPKKYFWDLSRYEVINETQADTIDAHKRTKSSPQKSPADRSLTTRLSKVSVSRIGTIIARDGGKAQIPKRPETPIDPDSRACFTRTLWYAIRESKSSAWVTKSGAAPNTSVWKQWLNEAEREAKAENRGWKAVARKDELIKEQAERKRAQAEKEAREKEAREKEKAMASASATAD
ncbi:uncharacterized protein DNG_07613 [Cephalotrichum gorgonifer]|uniref:Uncharacterized protein n=1 Tax=Cephalotrichum gorgonifer TaxID=2041049 RepID=A0AAE8N4I5_9PEZI|nr:uncharacterized protein DNG_07613 [Cephalotrichum gorgonifer]